MRWLEEIRLPLDQQMHRMHFERLEDGRLAYSPHGVRSVLARTRYVVSDEAVPQIIRLHSRISRYATIAAVAILLLATSLVLAAGDEAIGRLQRAPWLLLPGVVIVGMLPLWMPAWIVPILAGPLSRGPRRTLLEVGRLQEQRLGSNGAWLVFAIGLTVIVAELWIALDIVRRGYSAFAVSIFVGVIGLVPILLLAPAVMRVRRLRTENERLEALVEERTKELRELNRTLEARVEEQVRDIERLGQLKHFFSAPVAEMVLQGKGFDPANVHRRELTAVSIDLRGFTAFSETSEPEEVISVLRIYHAELGILVKRCHATLEHFAGDGVMIFLNDPVEVPDHPMRALELALALRDAMRPHVAEWRSSGFDVGLGIGIATGFATLGAVGYEGRWEYAAIGTVCNLAARLCAEAKDAQILVSQRFLSRLGDRVQCEPLGERPLKGLSRPVAMFNVLGVAS